MFRSLMTSSPASVSQARAGEIQEDIVQVRGVNTQAVQRVAGIEELAYGAVHRVRGNVDVLGVSPGTLGQPRAVAGKRDADYRAVELAAHEISRSVVGDDLPEFEYRYTTSSNPDI